MAKKTITKEETPSSTVVSISPKLKCFTVEKKGVGDWRVVTYEIQDDKILGKTMSDGGDKALSLERLKIMIAKEFFIGK